MSVKELRQRLQKLEQAEDISQTAYVTVKRTDGSEAHILWVDAVEEAVNGNIESVTGGMLGGLVEAMLTDKGVSL